MDGFDLVIVGGGVGGASLATAAARAGLAALVLEKSTVYRDHVRGEWMAPWGVIELKELGLYDSAVAGGGHHLSRNQALDEEAPLDEAVLQTLDLTTLLPGVRTICLGTRGSVEILIDQAAQAGVDVRRGVDDVSSPGGAPAHPTSTRARHEVEARLVVRADGRGSVVRRQAGSRSSAIRRIPLRRHADRGADAWPTDLQVVGSASTCASLIFPRGAVASGCTRATPPSQARRFAGANGPQAFLEAFRLDSIPGSEYLAGARPAGPCNSYPNEDTWTDRVVQDGLVLIGDAAGSNDPIIGQGLSITLRDVRLVRDALLGEREWTPRIFEPYAAERAERLRRLRFVATLMSALQNEFGPEASERRRRVHAMRMEDPSIIMPLMAAFIGPGNLPAEVFEEAAGRRFLGSA